MDLIYTPYALKQETPPDAWMLDPALYMAKYSYTVRSIAK